MTLESATIIEKTIDIHYLVSFDYKNMNKVMRIIKEKKLLIVAQKTETSCEIEIAIRNNNAPMVWELFSSVFEISIQTKE